ncbi:MAG: hypothetical protein ACOC35_15670 [Promethearchaeia archaeon]
MLTITPSKTLVSGARCYLSGPMDFVGSRVIEKFLGWRAILSPLLKALRITVLDPWNKPAIKGHEDYGKEGVLPSKDEYEKDFWTSNETRAKFETDFWETVHIDLRMVDIADFVVTFVPTNIYSVGTVHEIVTARNQFKPVLLISPPVKYEFFPEIDRLSDEVKRVLKYYGLKENPKGIPSQGYGNIVGGHYMFDGFGWESLKFKSSDFYESLIDEVIENAKPDPADEEQFTRWKRVKQWVEDYEPLQNLTGGVLDHVTFRGNEESMLEKELKDEKEQEREYFWYNTPYKPKRSVLYQLFNIASGYIPPRLKMLSHLDEDGEIQYESYESTDDNWLLIKHDEEKQEK